MKQQLENIENAAMTEASSSDSIKALDELRIKYLGKKANLLLSKTDGKAFC